jgi:hypothetical protein
MTNGSKRSGIALNRMPENESSARFARGQQSATVVSRISEDEVELNGDYEKPPLGAIHVTRTVVIE